MKVESPQAGFASAWRRDSNLPPLSEVFRTVKVQANATSFRRFLAFLGPGYLVAVGCPW